MQVEQATTGVRGMANPHTCQPGCVNLLNFLMGEFHGGNDGCYNPGSTLTSGKPSWHVFGKAIDVAYDWNNSAQRANGNRCWDWVLANREALNLQQMIFGNRIWDISYAGSGVHSYTRGDHNNHVHIAVGYVASQFWKRDGGIIVPDGYTEQDRGRDNSSHLMLIDITDKLGWADSGLMEGGYAKRAPANLYLPKVIADLAQVRKDIAAVKALVDH